MEKLRTYDFTADEEGMQEAAGAIGACLSLDLGFTLEHIQDSVGFCSLRLIVYRQIKESE